MTRGNTGRFRAAHDGSPADNGTAAADAGARSTGGSAADGDAPGGNGASAGASAGASTGASAGTRPTTSVSEPARYHAPRVSIDPDRTKTWLRRAMPILRAHRGIFVTSLVLSFVGLVLQVQIPNLLNHAIDNSVVRRTVPLHFYVWWVLGLGLAGGIAGYVSRLLLFQTAYEIEYDLRTIIYEHLTRMSFSFYDRVQSGQLISRANSDIRSVQMYMTFAPMILVQCSIAVVAFCFMLSIDVPLAFVAMVTMPFVFIVGHRMRKGMFPVSWLIQARLADVATIVDENVNGVRVVKSFAAEGEQLRSLAKAADKVQWGYVKDADLRARWTPAVQNLPQVGLALVLGFGGWMVIQGHLGLGAILAFNSYLLMLQAPFMMLGMIIMMGQRAAASAERIYEILDEKPTIVDSPGAVELTDCRGDVRFEHVGFSYGEGLPAVLADFDLHLHPGETVALVGRTGSGKSSVARLIPRFYDVTSGRFLVDGRDVRDLTIESLRANVGVVLDEAFLFSVSIRDNIAYGRPEADIADVEAAARAAGADAFIRELPRGYDTVVGERGYTLSGGQRQRISIARTLLDNPPILVLDDATSAIDVQVEQQIHDALRVLMQGRTTLIVAHRLSTISLADRVVLLEGGRIVADGTHAQLLESTPQYAEVLAQVEQEAPPMPVPEADGGPAPAGAGRPGDAYGGR
ncbi:MAG TPA: ABC transporter ATP-binding protein [Acidimicrobiales bacterium]|nr:ABC transporter ATP-binding protein [Acidimicrobiales bacterium]